MPRLVYENNMLRVKYDTPVDYFKSNSEKSEFHKIKYNGSTIRKPGANGYTRRDITKAFLNGDPNAKKMVEFESDWRRAISIAKNIMMDPFIHPYPESDGKYLLILRDGIKYKVRSIDKKAMKEMFMKYHIHDHAGYFEIRSTAVRNKPYDSYTNVGYFYIPVTIDFINSLKEHDVFRIVDTPSEYKEIREIYMDREEIILQDCEVIS